MSFLARTVITLFPVTNTPAGIGRTVSAAKLSAGPSGIPTLPIDTPFTKTSAPLSAAILTDPPVGVPGTTIVLRNHASASSVPVLLDVAPCSQIHWATGVDARSVG